MDFDALVTALQASAEAIAKPRPVEIPGVGTLYVRRRTIAEIDEAEEGLPEDAPLAKQVARGFVLSLCDENGARYSDAQRKQLAPLIEGQPESVLQRVRDAADGEDKKKVDAEGN